MCIITTFLSERKLKLPFSYNEIIQGFIYFNLDRILADFIHDQGFVYRKRSLTLFTFSRIIGKVWCCPVKAGVNFFVNYLVLVSIGIL